MSHPVMSAQWLGPTVSQTQPLLTDHPPVLLGFPDPLAPMEAVNLCASCSESFPRFQTKPACTSNSSGRSSRVRWTWFSILKRPQSEHIFKRRFKPSFNSKIMWHWNMANTTGPYRSCRKEGPWHATISTESAVTDHCKALAFNRDLPSLLRVVCAPSPTQAILGVWKIFKYLLPNGLELTKRTCERRFWATSQIPTPRQLPLWAHFATVTSGGWCSGKA